MSTKTAENLKKDKHIERAPLAEREKRETFYV